MTINKHLVFDDLCSFWRCAFQDSKARRRDSRYDSPSDWDGNVSWENAKRLAVSGWDEGLNEIDKVVAEMSPLISDKVLRPTLEYQVVGCNLDVGRYLSGDPECFQVKKQEVDAGAGRIITLVCSISCSADISSKTIIQKGAMVCALVDALECSGNRVEVVCNSASSKYSNQHSRQGGNKASGWIEVDITLKKANQSLNLAELAFCLGHPAMFRRMVFSMRELVGWSDFSHNYGYSSIATNRGDLYIGEIFSGTVHNSKAIAWVLEQLSILGVEIEYV